MIIHQEELKKRINRIIEIETVDGKKEILKR